MNDYNYNFEVSTNLKLFEMAIDNTVIKRYDDMTGRAADSIIVNYTYGPKNRILADLLGKPDTIKLPAVGITTTGFSRDNERIKNKMQDIVYQDEVTKEYINLRAIPFNINIQLTILCKYQQDLDQIIQNFAVYANPYIVYSWREPKSGREIRTEAVWDGNIAVEYPGGQADLPPNTPFRITGTANFTIKTWLYRTALTPIKPICFIPNDIITTNNFYCDYDTLTAYTSGGDMRDHYNIIGYPKIQYVNPYYILDGQTPTITIEGDGYLNTFALFVSGSNDVYPNMTTYYPKSASGDMTPYNGVIIPEFNIVSPRELSFTLPAPSAGGFIDIIAVNPCGMGQLTIDANRCNRVENPYPTNMPEHYNWCVSQFPFLNGLIVNYELNQPTEIICDVDTITYDSEYVDKEALITQIRNLMELGDITKDEL